MSAAGQLHAVMFWIVHSYCIKRLNAGELCKMNMFNQIDAADMDFFSGWYCVSVQQLGQLCCNDGVGLFAIGTARLKLQHLQAMTVTLMTQHKPIEKSTGMAFMIEKKQIQAWLNGLYTEMQYGQRMTSKHVHAGRRPGVPAPVMIQRNPVLHHPCSANNISQSVSR